MDQVPTALKADYQLVQNLMKNISDKHQQLDQDIIHSMKKWVIKLQSMGWHVMSHIQVKPKPKVFLAFSFLWQKGQIKANGKDLLCIYSTHNATKIIPELGAKKISTFTLLLRQPDTGCGLPVAWFLTSDETV